jgi:NADH-quinone oxidoreductase subunit G
VHGKPEEPTRFTIRAEKAPNRRGVEAVLKHYQGGVVSYDAVVQKLARGELDGLYVLNADPEAAFLTELAEQAGSLKLLVVQDLLASPLSDKAQFVLAGSAWAEKDGTFVNHAGLAQAIHRGLRGPAESRQDGRILWDLNQRHGLFHAATIRQELAGEIAELAALSLGDLGEQGVRLGTTGAPAELQPA